MSRPIAVLRPEPGNRATVERLRLAGFETVSMPLFEGRPRRWTAPEPAAYDRLLLTSASAVLHAGAELDRLDEVPAIVVGEATARAARAVGLLVVATGTQGVDALLRSIPGIDELRLLHLCGRHHNPGKIGNIDPIVVYESVAITPPRDAVSLLDGTVALLHSARAAGQLGKVVDASGLARARIALACMSAAVAGAAGEGWAAVAAADRPTDEVLIAVAGRLAD